MDEVSAAISDSRSPIAEVEPLEDATPLKPGINCPPAGRAILAHDEAEKRTLGLDASQFFAIKGISREFLCQTAQKCARFQAVVIAERSDRQQ